MRSMCVFLILIMISLFSCEGDKNMGEVIIDLTDIEYRPIEYSLNFPESFPQFEQPD